MTDCCIIGGGIIGLSIARELAGRGLSVRVVCRDAPRDTASWAAAGIFPPAPDHSAATPNERLTAFSDRLHRVWADELRTETGIDNELEPCGGLHLAGDAGGEVRLLESSRAWRARGARCDWLAVDDVVAIEPSLRHAVERGHVVAGFLLPEEMRIRPPRHLEALTRSCRLRGVEIVAGHVRAIDMVDGRIDQLRVSRVDGDVTEPLRAGHYCLAAGAWSGGLAEAFGLRVETRPIRGQIALVRLPTPSLARVVNVGLEYLVPRTDGRLLVGSTIEDAGFASLTTPQTIEALLGFAGRMLGPLADAPLERSWAGLRPGSVDGLPFIGAVPGCDNAHVATGHFRAGLHQSTGTAVLVADMITRRTSAIDPTAFAPGRTPGPPSADSVPAYLARAAAESP